MKTQFKRLLMLSLCLLCFSINSNAQDLTGIWRLKTPKHINGPDYANALPTRMTISQVPDKVEFKMTINLGDRDTVIDQRLVIKSINENLTKSGKKRLISFQKQDNNLWLKRTEIFSKENSKERRSIDEESYSIYNDGTKLNLYRKFDTNEDSITGNEDFTVEGTYEKIDPDLLVKETSTGTGVIFLEGLNWEQIKVKAKAENKYIFVDCYATWCGPCKVMDKDVYPLNTVGQALNDKFISVKIQMDSVKSDPINIKKFYSTARAFERDYKISGLPSYLFFSPDGVVLHKGMGAQSSNEFIQLIKDSLDPNKQFFTHVKSLREGKMDVNLVPAFIQRIKDNGDEEIALELAGIFMRNYLEKLPNIDFITKQNLGFITSYSKMLTSKDRLFASFSENAKSIDSLIRPGFSDAMIDYILGKELVQSAYEKAINIGTEPDWKSVFNKLSRQVTTRRSDNIVLFWKCRWYKQQKDWTNYAKYLFESSRIVDIKRLPDFGVLALNSVSWDLFSYSFDQKALELGITWIDKAIELFGNEDGRSGLLDTKANLLYKLGKKDEAIKLQSLAMSLDPQNPSIKKAFDKMANGKPTWTFGVK